MGTAGALVPVVELPAWLISLLFHWSPMAFWVCGSGSASFVSAGYVFKEGGKGDYEENGCGYGYG